ncbi:NUMOD4 domain-containing protein [Bacillus hominis]|uniref:NUMOD4 domain-containing protein n=1 Tax=Bacillus hominis TaxID=2817478 RepID=UPI0025A03FF1|nr:NUMOD4 domain-containing protein [Bacillus hominis]MDM5434391.1 NUMOD4 domain-containing protein [Bacillus hominis]
MARVSNELEVWKDIEDYEGKYQVSSLGRVKSLDRIVRHSGNHERIQHGKILKLTLNSVSGYLQVGLYLEGKVKKYNVHRLVAETFINNPGNKPEVNHIDENKTNNTVINLEWCTRKENENHGTKKQRKTKNTDYESIRLKNSKVVIQYDSSGKLINEWNSIADINKQLGYSKGNISGCCNGKLEKAYGYVWKFKGVV